jgi:hypothetical protein
VDVEEHLYRLATNMGITVITSSQVFIILFLFLAGSSLAVAARGLNLSCPFVEYV